MPFSPLPTLRAEGGGDHSPECQGLLPFSEARWLGDASWAFRQHISQKGLSLAPGTQRGRATNLALCMSSVLSIETSACEQRGHPQKASTGGFQLSVCIYFVNVVPRRLSHNKGRECFNV